MSNYRKSKNFILLIIDLVLVSLSFISAIFITKKRLIMMEEVSAKTEAIEIILLVLFLLVWIIFSNLLDIYDSFKIVNKVSEILALLKCVIIQLLIAVFLLFFIKNILFSRFFLFSYILILLILIYIIRPVLKIFIKIFKRESKFTRKILIIGNNRSGTEFYKMIYERSDPGYRIIGMLSKNKPEEEYKIHLGNLEEIEEILHKNEVDDVVISLEESENNQLNSILTRCENHPIRIKIIPEYSRFLSKRFHFDTFGRIPIISVKDDPLDNLFLRFVKRFFDILLSVSVLVCMFIWVYPLIAIMIKLTSRGPVFFKQERWGRKNRKITVYKFRTMKAESRDIDINGNYNQAIKNDPRITSIGSFLRRTNLDEIPQILNVIIGNMSIVGPRPHPTPLNIESKVSVARYLKRHLVKPGITGWAQVNGLRGETKKEGLMEKRVAHDIWYIENWSFLLDIQIILLTVWNMIKGEANAY